MAEPWSLKLYGRTEDPEGVTGAVAQLVEALQADPDLRGVLHVENYAPVPYGSSVPAPEEPAPEEVTEEAPPEG